MKESLMKQIEVVEKRKNYYQEKIRDAKYNMEHAIKTYSNTSMLKVELGRYWKDIDAYTDYLVNVDEELMMIKDIAIDEKLEDVFRKAQDIQDTLYHIEYEEV